MGENLWTAFEAAAATGGALCSRGGDPERWLAEEWSARGISIDTRTLSPGEIFVALKDARDGHEFVESAFQRGASAALVAKPPANTPAGKPLLVVRDTLEGLRDLARAARVRNFGKRIAVTGSVGKTSTKEMLRVALSSAGDVHAADKSYNNHWGVPLTLARMPMKCDFGVFEIGMNHAGEITPLTHLVAPHVAIITNVEAAHLEFFASVAAIAEAKAEIFSGVEKGGTAILPIDNEHFALLRKRARKTGVQRIISFGADAKADVRLTGYKTDGETGLIEAEIFGDPLSFRLGAPGRHQAMNALAALSAAYALGVPVKDAADELADLGAAAGRGARHEIAIAGGGKAVLIDESYNANPTSMAAALALLGAAKPRGTGRRIAILGDMLELGAQGPALHAGLGDALVAANTDRLYVAGGLMTHLWDAAPAAMKAKSAPDASALINAVLADLQDGDVIMVKGSNASKVSEIVRALKTGGAPDEFKNTGS